MRTKIGKSFLNGARIIIYSSNPVKAIVATAKIKEIQHLTKDMIDQNHLKKVCISKDFFDRYMEYRKDCYLIELEEIKKLKNPLTLQNLKMKGFTAPQSFCYTSNDIEKLVISSL